MLEQNKIVLRYPIQVMSSSSRSYLTWQGHKKKKIQLQLQYRQVLQTVSEKGLQEYDLTLLEASKFLVWIVSAWYPSVYENSLYNWNTAEICLID